MLGFPFFLLGAVVVAVWSVIMVVRIFRTLWDKRWREGGMLLVVILAVWPIMWSLRFSGDYVHLATLYPSYRAKLDASSGYATFPWGLAGFVGSERERTLVYDASDKITTQLGSRKAPEIPGAGKFTTHLIGHFYVVDLSL